MPAPRAKLWRRLRFGAATCVVVAAWTVSAVMLNLIAEHAGVRADVTALGEHRLSERTTNLIATLEGPHEIVVAADWAARDRRVTTRVRDAASRFDEASADIETSFIDTGSATGLAEYDRLLNRLAERDAERLQAQRRTIEALASRLDRLAKLFQDLAPALDALAATIEGPAEATTYLTQRAGAATGAAARLARHAEGVRAHLDAQIGPVAAPDVEAVKALLSGELPGIDTQLTALADNLEILADAQTIAEEPRRSARALERRVRGARDAWAVAAERAGRLKPSELARVAKAMRAGEAAIVFGPERVVGVDTRELLPPGQWLDTERGVEADIGRRAEELLASALGAIATPDRPIVVVLHSQPDAFLDKVPVLSAVRERLELHGVDFVEWPAAIRADHPDLSEINPDASRPVVYLAMGSDTSVGTESQGGMSGPERAQALADALDRVVEAGSPLLLTLWHSTLPGYGMDDPSLRALEEFGLTAQTGKPILLERSRPDGRRVGAEHRIEAVESDHPLCAALRGLPTAFYWPVGIRPIDAPGDAEITHTPLYQITDADAWGESQWAALWQWQSAEERRGPMPNPPSPDPGRDWTDGPFTVALAAERRPSGAPAAQRLLVVGSYSWLFDGVTRQAMLIDERVVPQNPGNAELFDAAISWLAGQDHLIARSPTARAAPRIRPIDPARLTALRWALVAGLPGLALLLGALWWLLAR